MTEENVNQRLGIVVDGSVDRGVEVRLDSVASVEDMVVGRYVTIEGQKRRFFGMITDISLGVTDQELTIAPPKEKDSFITEVLSGTATYSMLHVLPMLTMGIEGPEPVKTVPSHFSTVNMASDTDMELVFGEEDDTRFFVGNPLDMETRLCLNLPEFVKRSNGIFGKSGTGKTFLTRILLIGMLQKSKAVNLIFDMHNEYGWEGSSEEGQRKVKALKQLFPDKVAVFTLDPENARRRKVSTDFEVRIGYDEVEPEGVRIMHRLQYVAANARLHGVDNEIPAIVEVFEYFVVAEMAQGDDVAVGLQVPERFGVGYDRQSDVYRGLNPSLKSLGRVAILGAGHDTGARRARSAERRGEMKRLENRDRIGSGLARGRHGERARRTQHEPGRQQAPRRLAKTVTV